MKRNIELLVELFLLNDMHDAPNKTERCGKWYQSTIPIGDNHTAYLTIDDAAFEELKKEIHKDK